MKIRCKFQCTSVSKICDWNQKEAFTYSADFSAVSGGSDENKQFWKWTPSGNLKVTSITCEKFQPGKEYYIDISDALTQS